MTKHPRGMKMSTAKVLQKRSRLIRHSLFLMYPDIPADGLNKIISQIKPGVTFLAIEAIPSTHLSRLFDITLSDGTILRLSIPPIFGVRLLRQEQKLMLAQIALIIFLNNIRLISSNIFHLTSSSIDPSLYSQLSYTPSLSALCRLVPDLLVYSQEEKDLTVPYILSAPTRRTEGTPLSDLSPYLTQPEQHTINHQIGTLSRTLSLITSPNQKFGLAADVLSSLVPPSRPPGSSSTTLGSQASSTWSHAFAVLLESAMRDAEDMLVNLPYHEIRRYVRDYSHYFDEIKVSRLLILNLTDPDNVLVAREEFPSGVNASEDGVRVVGLRDWSKGVFGDVMLADVWEGLRDVASVANGDADGHGFLDGWRDISVEADDKGEGAEMIMTDDTSIRGNAEVNEKFRELMYICYRAVITIATEYQRPRPDSMKRDDVGRMRLTSALKELRALESVLDT